ncbi:Cytochrome P450 monooxygenase [Cladobotryum mycophilum]|uniref:Cytochrome P450 monooxygenase n=1 Tax=Cladobotryum mycophilum TaxID=491253 RepID=A0ABR0SJ21_9HYPO
MTNEEASSSQSRPRDCVGIFKSALNFTHTLEESPVRTVPAPTQVAAAARPTKCLRWLDILQVHDGLEGLFEELEMASRGIPRCESCRRVEGKGDNSPLHGHYETVVWAKLLSSVSTSSAIELPLLALVAITGPILLGLRGGISVVQAAELGLGMFLVSAVTLKVLKALIYPFYLSGLRHLPAPKTFLIGQGLRLLSAAGPNDLYLEWSRTWLDTPLIGYISWVEELFNSSALGVICYKAILNPPLLGKLITFVNPFTPLRMLPIEANFRFIRANKALKAMISELIEERAKAIITIKIHDEIGGRNFLTGMIEESIPENHRFIQFVSAGHDTTGCSLTWMIYALAINIDTQNRLREEILVAQVKQLDLDAVTIDNMRYLHNVARENLRLYSPTLLAPWETAEDLVIADTKKSKSATITTIPAMMNQLRQVWGDDADDFRPDRWDNLSDSAASPFAIESFLTRA